MQNAVSATNQQFPIFPSRDPDDGQVQSLLNDIKDALPPGADVFLMPMGTSRMPERMGLAVLFDRENAFGILERLGFHISGPLANGYYLACAVLSPV